MKADAERQKRDRKQETLKRWSELKEETWLMLRARPAVFTFEYMEEALNAPKKYILDFFEGRIKDPHPKLILRLNKWLKWVFRESIFFVAGWVGQADSNYSGWLPARQSKRKIVPEGHPSLEQDTGPTDKKTRDLVRSIFYREMADHPSLSFGYPKEGTPESRVFELINQRYPLTTKEAAELGRLASDIYNRAGLWPDFLVKYAAEALGKMGNTEEDEDPNSNPNSPLYRDRCVDNLARGFKLILEKTGEPKRKTSEVALFSYLHRYGRRTKKEWVECLMAIDSISKNTAIDRIESFLAEFPKDENGNMYTPVDEIREKLRHRWAGLPADHPLLHVTSLMGGFEAVAQAIDGRVLKEVMQTLNADELDAVIRSVDAGDLDLVMISCETVLMNGRLRYADDVCAKTQDSPA